MSTDAKPLATRIWTSVRSIWFPVVVVGLFGVLVAVLWWWSAWQGRAVRNMALPVAVLALLAVLFAWLLVARLPMLPRLLGIGLVVLPPIAVATLYEVENVRFDGDMFPLLQPRWWSQPDDILERHLAGVKDQAVPQSVNLTGQRPTDWPAYRGANRDGIVLGPDLLRDWRATPPRLLWQHPIGGGHSAFVVADKALFTMEQRRDQEVIVGYDAATGNQFWAFSYAALWNDPQGDKGPRSTPTVVDVEVYALGATGLLTCVDAQSGKPKWGPIDLLAGNGNISWGLSGSPLVVGDLVLVNTGVQKGGAPHGTLVAVERKTGKVAWSTGKAQAGYSSPMLATLGGKQQVVLFDADGVAGYDLAAKGKELWRQRWRTSYQINVAQPLIIGNDQLFISSAYRTGCALLEVKEVDGVWKVKQIWKTDGMHCKFTSPVYYQGHIYGLDDNQDEVCLVCLDARNGGQVWRGPEFRHGQLLLSKDLLIVQSEFGEVALVQATPQEYRELGKIRPWTQRTWNLPAMADGRLYLRNNREMACYDLAGK
jgi:outer membrane protein assembly factor BamB